MTSYLSSRDVVVVIVTCVLCGDVTLASSDFYYDNWQCNNYLSAESVVVQATAGHLLEIHVRDDIPVSDRTHLHCSYTAISLGTAQGHRDRGTTTGTSYRGPKSKKGPIKIM